MDKRACIEDTVEKLLEEGEHASDPVLLLGKIQCGKTDTFENIVGLAFDKGIDIAVVMTKGTQALAEQTLKRMRKDYRFFANDDTIDEHPFIDIHDVMNIKSRGLKEADVNRHKTVIICKKETTNLRHLTDIFKKQQFLREKKVLVVDDEADFASRNYMVVHDELKDSGITVQEQELKMAKIARQIDDFRRIPAFCRYLQVTATPYCLYLQPQGIVNLKDGKAEPFRPRYTALVPVHNKYIGGKEYFEDSEDRDSMYSHLYHRVDDKCMDVMGKQDQRYAKSGVRSKNLKELTRAMWAYCIGSVIRQLQEEKTNGRTYNTSMLVHVEVSKGNHMWQKQLLKTIMKNLAEYIHGKYGQDELLDGLTKEIWEDFEASNQKARNAGLITVGLPPFADVRKRLDEVLSGHEYEVAVVNSDQDVHGTLINDETGELNLSMKLNIFIGGSILDRGITIKNMTGFFYGRDPKKFQQDTVLQHARMYGARSKEDMAVTRFHTTERIYCALKQMNEIDNKLRDQLEKNSGNAAEAVYVGYEGHIKPCASQKIKVSNVTIIKEHRRVTPSGMQTHPKSKIGRIVKAIDKQFETFGKTRVSDENGFFEMTFEEAREILEQIKSTYVYEAKYDNKDHKSDMSELICNLEYSTQEVPGKKLWAVVKGDREISRARADGTWELAPDAGNKDTAPARLKAEEQPVVMFFRENGRKSAGWNGAEFYWPVLITQRQLTPAMFALETKSNRWVVAKNIDNYYEGIDREKMLSLTYDGTIEDFGNEQELQRKCESRVLTKNTAPRYLERKEKVVGDEELVWKTVENADVSNGVYSYNGGKFPFVLRDFKWMDLRIGRSGNCDRILLELEPREKWKVEAEMPEVRDETGEIVREGFFLNEIGEAYGEDVEIGEDMTERIVVNENLCRWTILYGVKRVVRRIEKISQEEAEAYLKKHPK